MTNYERIKVMTFEELAEFFCANFDFDICSAREMLKKNFDSIQEVKHAKWETIIDHCEETLYGCSNCKYEFVTLDGEHPKENGMNFCPHCGAKMDKE